MRNLLRPVRERNRLRDRIVARHRARAASATTATAVCASTTPHGQTITAPALAAGLTAPVPGGITLAWLGEQYVTSGNHGDEYIRSDYRRDLTRYVNPFFGRACDGDVDVAMIMTRPPNPVREPSSGGTLGRMNVNVRRVWVTQCAVVACGVAFLVGFVGQPMAYNGLWNSDGFIWAALLVSALVLGATFGLVGGLAARAGYTWMAQAAVVAFAPLALAIPAVLCGRWFLYDPSPRSSNSMVPQPWVG